MLATYSEAYMQLTWMLIFQDDRTCWMEAIKPGSCKEILAVSRHTSETEEEEDSYVTVNNTMYDYATNTQLGVKVQDSEKKADDLVFGEVSDERLYDNPQLDTADDRPPLPPPRPPARLPQMAQPSISVLYADQHNTASKVSSATPSITVNEDKQDDACIYEDYDDIYSFPVNGSQLSKTHRTQESQHPVPSLYLQLLPSFPSEPPPPPPDSRQEPLPEVLQSSPHHRSKPSPSFPSREKNAPLHESHPLLSPVKKSASFPRNLSTFSELSLDDLSNLSQSEIQTWTLIQMQKLVQKMENVYETIPEARSPTRISSKWPGMPLSPRKSKAVQHHPAQRDTLYVNAEDLERVLSDHSDPPPPLPPRISKGQSSEEVETVELKQPQKEERNVCSQPPHGKCHKPLLV